MLGQVEGYRGGQASLLCLVISITTSLTGDDGEKVSSWFPSLETYHAVIRYPFTHPFTFSQFG